MKKPTDYNWKVREQGDANHYVILEKGGMNWVMAIQQNGEMLIAEQRQINKLIVAAPKMLEFIENLEGFYFNEESAEEAKEIFKMLQ